MNSRTALPIGAWAAILGGLLAIVANLFAPRPDPDDVGDPTALVDVAATTGSWELIESGVTVALLLLVAFYAITRSIEEPSAAIWARLGLGAMLLGTTFVLFPISSGPLTLIVIYIGVLLFRRVSGPPRAAHTLEASR